MTLSSILILLQMSVSLLTGVLMNANATIEQKAQAIDISTQSIRIVRLYLQEQNAPTVDDKSKNYYENNITTNVMGAPSIPKEEIQKTDCSIPQDDPQRKILNEYELKRVPLELREHLNSIALFNWYKSTYGFCI